MVLLTKLSYREGTKTRQEAYLAMYFFEPQVHIVKKVTNCVCERHDVIEMVNIGLRQLIQEATVAESLQYSPHRLYIILLDKTDHYA